MSALDLASAVRSGERSAVDVIDEHLARIDARDGEIKSAHGSSPRIGGTRN